MLIFLLRQLKLIVWKLRNRRLFGSLALNEGDVWEPAWCKELCIALDCWPKYGNISRKHNAGKSLTNFPVSLRLRYWSLHSFNIHGVLFAVSSVARVIVTPSVLCIPAWYMIVSLPTYLLHYISEFLTVPSVLTETRPGLCSVRIWAWQGTHCSLLVVCDNRIGSPVWEGNFSATVQQIIDKNGT